MNPNNAEIRRLTKESIAIAAAELLLSDLSLSVTSICKRAGVSRNAFYRNFEEIDDILIYYLIMKWGEYSEVHSVAENPQDQIGGHLIRFFYEYRNYIRALKKRDQVYLIEKLFVKVIIPEDANGAVRYACYGMAYLIYGIIRAMIDNDFSDTPEMIEDMTRLQSLQKS
jgi:AcrR family transcriptional regulator